MKKISIFVLVLFLFFLTSCKKRETIDNAAETITYQDLKEEDFDVTKYELDEIPLVFVEKLSRITNFTKETKGETIAKKVIKYTQVIDSVYSEDSSGKHLVTISNSTLVKLYHEAYYKEDIISFKTKEKDEFSDITYEEYVKKYGFLPYGHNLEGYDITKDSIINIEKVEDYKYHLVIDGDKGSNNVKIQMKEFGNLSDYPSFSLVSIDITMKQDFTPISVHVYSEYEITHSFLGKTNCTQEYTVTYSINE